ncbi:sensor histidine kinase [Paenibacillus sp. MCAF9]|uniref:sensor histidine kinase n=1 Tax=Paenibacillus sp. MCAF9 TaxID=3233046 RepID=UPI003F9CFE0C
MSIRLKLLLSYAAMLVIPLISIILISLLMVIVFRGDLQGIKSIYESTEELFGQEEVKHIAQEIKRSVELQPNILNNQSYLEEMTNELQKRDSEIIVRVDGEVLYRSLDIQKFSDVSSNLPPFNRNEAFRQYPAKKIGNANYSFMQFDFHYQNNKQGTLFIISKVNPTTYFIRKYFPTLFLSLIFVLIVTHILLTTFMSKNIIRPLQALRNAASEIKEGNLDFQIKVNGKDEIGQLGIMFEEMRSRLQTSIQVQEQYEVNRKELISNISHDLKTPLTTIRGYIDGILDGVADTPEKNLKYMQTIAVKAEELDHLINELFLYSKLDLNQQQFHFEAVNVLAFLMDWSEELEFELEKQGITYHSDIQLDPSAIFLLDRDQFKRVLNNIIQNSVRYMDKQQPSIQLTAHCTESEAILEIRDNGSGIDPEALQHIFERFYRADESRNARTGGSGLGLAIAKQIMLGHQGGIEAYSKLRVGTTIKLCIPIATRG